MRGRTAVLQAVFAFLPPCLRTSSPEVELVTMESVPLTFEDIVDARTYDKMRPPRPGGQPTKVEFHVTVMSLDSINEGSMTYAADIFFGQSWEDHRLKLPANMTGDYRLLPVEWLHNIWRPDSFFKNAKQVTFQRMTIPNHYIWLYNSKKIMYMVKLTLVLTCAMKFNKYPHDEQICKLSMESLSHTTDDLIFMWLAPEEVPLVVDEGIELPQLELIANYTADCTTNYSTGTFTCLEVVFRLRRRLGYFMFHTYIPTCLIVMMSWISFWIKPEAVPARVTLGVTSLLTLSTQHANSQKSLPPVSYIKAIDMFMSSCTFFVFLSLIEYAFVNVMMGDISEIERKDRGVAMKNFVTQQRILRNIKKTQHSGNGAEVDAYRETQLVPVVPSPTAETANQVDSKLVGEECPRHNNSNSGPQAVSRDFRHMLGLEPNNLNSNPPLRPPPSTSRMKDAKEIMKKRRERAICIDRVSRVLFPSTFVLLNIIYWLVFSDILASVFQTSDPLKT